MPPTALEKLGRCFYLMSTLQDEIVLADPFLDVVSSGPGRPKYNISCEQLEHLLGIGLTCPAIANCLGVSLRTVRRRMTDFGLSVAATYLQISDAEFDGVVNDIKKEFPNCGLRMLNGHLRRKGIRITQDRLRECMHRTDPIGSAVRWAKI